MFGNVFKHIADYTGLTEMRLSGLPSTSERLSSEGNAPSLVSGIQKIFSEIAAAGTLSPARYEIDFSLPSNINQPYDNSLPNHPAYYPIY